MEKNNEQRNSIRSKNRKQCSYLLKKLRDREHNVENHIKEDFLHSGQFSPYENNEIAYMSFNN